LLPASQLDTLFEAEIVKKGGKKCAFRGKNPSIFLKRYFLGSNADWETLLTFDLLACLRGLLSSRAGNN
jgi:hypothetical protein